MLPPLLGRLRTLRLERRKGKVHKPPRGTFHDDGKAFGQMENADGCARFASLQGDKGCVATDASLLRVHRRVGDPRKDGRVVGNAAGRAAPADGSDSDADTLPVQQRSGASNFYQPFSFSSSHFACDFIYTGTWCLRRTRRSLGRCSPR